MADRLWLEKLPFHQQRCFNPARGRRWREDWSRGIKSPASIIPARAYFASNTGTFCFLSILPTAVRNKYGDSFAYSVSLFISWTPFSLGPKRLGSVRKDPAGTIQWRQSFRGWRALRVTIFPFHDTTRTLKWNTSSYVFYLVISSDSIKWKGF